MDDAAASIDCSWPGFFLLCTVAVLQPGICFHLQEAAGKALPATEQAKGPVRSPRPGGPPFRVPGLQILPPLVVLLCSQESYQ